MTTKSTVLFIGASMLCASAFASEVSMRIYDNTVFYDGYLLENNPDRDLQDGIIRHTTSHYATRLSDHVLDRMGATLRMDVTVSALCDNYDRIGNVNLAFVAKGQSSYNPAECHRMELARFITPFMNKNKKPNEVPYSFDLDNVSAILRDQTLRDKYDFWLEFEIFGIPYAANEQIAGCKDRNDVFAGTIDFVTSDTPAGISTGNVLVPIVIKNPEYIGKNFNNYSEEATDQIGKAVKTYRFSVPEDVKNSQIVLIMSNHGANAGGEEYNRRRHFVYIDDKEVMQFTPGRTSCEPYRAYNTQPNGIYGWSAMTDKQWQSFSNWCPGAEIPTRFISLGAMKAGDHSIRIEVPDAKFVDSQGDFPVSMYHQGSTDGSMIIGGISSANEEDATPQVEVSVNGKTLTMRSRLAIATTSIYDISGECLYCGKSAEHTDISFLSPGIYIAVFATTDGNGEAHKIFVF